MAGSESSSVAAGGTGATVTPVLECRNLSISFFGRGGEIPAVVDFDFKLMPGEAHGIVGESGCGKSTFALAVMQYLRNNGAIVGGEILFEGHDMRAMSEQELGQLRGSAISMVYQEPMASLNPSMKVGAQLAEVQVYHKGVRWQEGWDRGREMLDNVRLPDLDRIMEAYPHRISGGQLQRVVIDMAQLSNPCLLLLDEPTTALDVTVEAGIVELIISTRFGISMVYISYNLGLILETCSRLWRNPAGQGSFSCWQIAPRPRCRTPAWPARNRRLGDLGANDWLCAKNRSNHPVRS